MAVAALGTVEYAAAERLQQQLVTARQAGAIGDLLLLLEHPPVVTLGRNARREHLRLPAPALARRGIGVAACNRGGDVSFHGTGRLVGYPILDLRQTARPPCRHGWRRGRGHLGPGD